MFILCLACLGMKAEDNRILRIVSYNVENLFDCKHDSLKNDSAYLEGGEYHWTFARYRQKLHGIAKVIASIGEWQAPAIVGLLEVENDSCLRDLNNYHLRRHYPYGILHYESPDARGVDVAMLYDTTRLNCISSRPLRIPVLPDSRPTRDVLYAQFVSKEQAKQDSIIQPIHVMLCHLPSQLGGAKASSFRRQQVVDLISQLTDSILRADSAACILVMGDMNMQPADNLPGLRNLMLPYARAGIGTHKYRENWTCLDQIYVSAALYRLAMSQDTTQNQPDQLISPAVIYRPEWLLETDERYLGERPFRTYIGPCYHGGYSDHLPIYIDIRL